MTGKYENVNYNKACMIVNAILNGRITYEENTNIDVIFSNNRARCGFYKEEKLIAVYDERKGILTTYLDNMEV